MYVYIGWQVCICLSYLPALPDTKSSDTKTPVYKVRVTLCRGGMAIWQLKNQHYQTTVVLYGTSTEDLGAQPASTANQIRTQKRLFIYFSHPSQYDGDQ